MSPAAATVLPDQILNELIPTWMNFIPARFPNASDQITQIQILTNIILNTFSIVNYLPNYIQPDQVTLNLQIQTAVQTIQTVQSQKGVVTHGL